MIEKNFSSINIAIINYFMFFVGVGSSVYFKIVGTFGYSEVPIFILSIFSIIYAKKIQKEFFFIFLASLAWLIGIFLSDLINNTNMIDTIKLIGSLLLISINIFGFFHIMKLSHISAVYFVIGNGFSNLLQFYYLPPPLMAADYSSNFNDNLDVRLTWIAITHFLPCISIAGLLWFRKLRKTAIILILLSGLGTLYLGSRAYFLVAVLSVLLLFAAMKTQKLGNSRRRNLIIFFSILIGLIIAALTYKILAQSGVLGEFAQNKYMWQNETESIGLLSGRIDFIESLYAVYLNPIVGYGSYASENYGISEKLYAMLGISSIETREGLPNHSHILGAWAYSGILALPFWVYLIVLIVKGIWRVIDYPYAGFYIPYALVAIWNIFFSPMGYRGELVFVIATTLLILSRKNYQSDSKEQLSYH